MKQLILMVLMGGLLYSSGWAAENPQVEMPGDSIGLKVVKGKAYVMYKISKGDNLSSIARVYRSSIADIQSANDMQGSAISIGQVLLVPSRAKVGQNQAVGSRSQHSVQAGESLYAISKKYNVGIDDLKTWNKLQSDGLSIGQKLWVQAHSGQAAVKPAKTPEKTIGEAQPNPKPKTVTETVAKPAPKTQAARPGIHVVGPGETLYAIAKRYDMAPAELRKLNRLETPTIREGQELKVKQTMAGNSNQGMALSDALEASEETPVVEGPPSAADTAGKPLEGFPELKVLTAPVGTTLPAEAIVSSYVDKYSGKHYKRVQENGKAARIEDFSTDQTKFFAFHKQLPVGTYFRLDYPEKGQSILVEVVSKLPASDPNLVRITAKCMDYLMIRGKDAEVQIRYVVPLAK